MVKLGVASNDLIDPTSVVQNVLASANVTNVSFDVTTISGKIFVYFQDIGSVTKRNFLIR